jgi:hypothetical protein
MRLQLGLNEVEGPGVNGWCDALKYQCIPLFLDIPASYHKDLHEYPLTQPRENYLQPRLVAYSRYAEFIS